MRWFKSYRLHGHSLAPHLPQHSLVISMRWLNHWRLPLGSTVVVEHPQLGQLVKRLHRIDENGRLWLRGEHPDGLSSEQMGPVSRHCIKGRVIFSVAATPARHSLRHGA
ncbi:MULTISPECIES: hypothetical protein [Cobetia]|uniref:Nickel-type superoxide dismutase maturation protease n=1 Tax=Cobetia crustatorum TaxID=553385 RepID=A0A558HH47_9GAMM|nr:MULTISPECIES: hypothetical protein [Cobetia]TVU68450.1 hypothetical protein FQP86_14780 [Cobetia crustatorum]